jgi:hypothetical protein
MGTSNKRSLRVFAAAAACLFVVGCDRAAGKAAVDKMCQKDGGLHVYHRVRADGYLDETCVNGCVPELLEGRFAFIDSHADAYGGTYNFTPYSYYRASIADSGDARCGAYWRAVNRKSVGPYTIQKMPAGKCIAFQRLSERPAGYAYSTQFRRAKADDGFELGVYEQTIKDARTGALLAVNRDYLFTSKWTRRLDMSGGGGKLDASCPGAQKWKFDYLGLLAEVLGK